MNNLTKVLGFDGLADFEKGLPYSNLKSNQKNICQEFTKSLEEFKNR